MNSNKKNQESIAAPSQKSSCFMHIFTLKLSKWSSSKIFQKFNLANLVSVKNLYSTWLSTTSLMKPPLGHVRGYDKSHRTVKVEKSCYMGFTNPSSL